jgi:hypothetical membrane protein
MSESSIASSTFGEGTLQRFAALGGPAMVVLWLGGILVATLLDPSFGWTSNTLAELGRAGQPSALVNDVSVVLGGSLGLLFLWRVWSESTNNVQRSGVAFVGLIVLLLSVAQLGVQNPWLELMALVFILFTLPALALHGSGDVFAGRPRRGVLSIWLGIVHILEWQVLSIILGLSSAIPAYVSLVLLSVWVLAQYSSLGGEPPLTLGTAP